MKTERDKVKADITITTEIDLRPKIDKGELVQNWISSTNFDLDTSDSDVTSSIASNDDLESTVYSSSIVTEDLSENMQGLSIKVGQDEQNQIITNAENANVLNKIDVLQHIFNTTNSVQTLGNVIIENSKGVHIGNITYVTGPIHITQTEGGNIGAVYQGSGPKEQPSNNMRENNKPPDRSNPPERQSNTYRTTPLGEEEEGEREEFNRSDSFIGNIRRNIEGNVLRIVNRMTWLAQRPLEQYNYIDGPVPYVIISHTGSEDALTQAENVYLVRNIQCFHIESRRWNDIAYNFLIGSDGNVYEGRGWKVVGAHTYGYNKKSVGISFIGCFMRELPPPVSLQACKLLIERGVELGHISPNYSIVCHCQCSPTESPGRMLFEEIKTWPHFAIDP